MTKLKSIKAFTEYYDDKMWNICIRLYDADGRILAESTPSHPQSPVVFNWEGFTFTSIDAPTYERPKKDVYVRITDKIKFDTLQLKPCPFCGSEAKVIPHANSSQFCVVCQHPEALCNARLPYCDSVEEAQKAWNTRIVNELL